MTNEVISLIETFNLNVEWLRKNQHKLQLQSVPIESNSAETFVDIEQAKALLNRSRTWITLRMKTAEELAEIGSDTSQFLVYGLDWHREGNRVIFQKQSIVRLKEILKQMGDRYQRRSKEKAA